MSDNNATKAQGAGIGALFGAAAGAGIGALAAGGKGAAWGAGIGAVLGGAGGYWWGSTVAERKANYVNEEDRLDGEITTVIGYNHKLKEENDQKEIRIARLKMEVAELKSRYRNGTVRERALRAKQSEINSAYCDGEKCKNHMNKELTALSNYQKSINGTKDPRKVAKLNREIAALKHNIEMLDANNRQLARLHNSLAGVRK